MRDDTPYMLDTFRTRLHSSIFSSSSAGTQHEYTVFGVHLFAFTVLKCTSLILICFVVLSSNLVHNLYIYTWPITKNIRNTRHYSIV